MTDSADLKCSGVCGWLSYFVDLSQVLQNLGKDKFPSLSFEQVGTRIAKVLEKV